MVRAFPALNPAVLRPTMRSHTCVFAIVRPGILAVTPTSGLIEAVPDTVSLHALKKKDPSFTTLSDFFLRHFGRGDPNSRRLRAAKKNFVRSLAAYSIVCYIMQLKDRHNGNILLDADGHVVHIDFGFLLGASPGGNMGFEAAPFKLTAEFVEVMGGTNSRLFGEYRALCAQAYLAARRHSDKIMLLVRTWHSCNRDLPCFADIDVMTKLQDRFNLGQSSRKCVAIVDDLIAQSLDNWRTRWYDSYQRCCVGVL